MGWRVIDPQSKAGYAPHGMAWLRRGVGLNSNPRVSTGQDRSSVTPTHTCRRQTSAQQELPRDLGQGVQPSRLVRWAPGASQEAAGVGCDDGVALIHDAGWGG